jgi:hypothetical protein
MRLTVWRLALAGLASAALIMPASIPTAASPDPQDPTAPIVAEQTTGGGASFMRVAVTRHGNLWFASPKGVALTTFDEGYALCRRDEVGEDTAYAYDLPLEDVDAGDVGLGPVTVNQASTGAFPVTITRKTLDGTIRLTQTWEVPDTSEKDVTVTMTVRNAGTSTLEGLRLMRSADSHSDYADAPDSTFFRGATTVDSVFQWWDADANGAANGLVMTARTVGVSHEAGLSSDIDLALYCGGFSEMEPSDLSSGGSPQIVYFLPSLRPGAEVSVAFTYRRL